MKPTSTHLATLVAVSALYFAGAKLGLSIAFPTPQVSAVWPPSGIAFVACALFGYRVWPAIYLGAFLSNVTTPGEPISAAAVISVGNTLSAVVGVFLARRFGFNPALTRVRDVLCLVAFGAVVGPLVSATNGVLNLASFRLIPWSACESVWGVWWVGDSLGVLVVGPFFLTWIANRRLAWRGLQAIEPAALVIGVLVVSLVVFVGRLTGPAQSIQLEYVAFPFLIWAGLRFGPRETATTALLVAGVAVWGAIHERGPFADVGADARLIQLDTFIAVMGMTALLVGAVTAERRRAYDALVLRVSDRTADRFQFAIEAASTGMIIVDDTGSIVLVNAQVERLFGYTRGELIGRSIEILVPERHRAHHPGFRAVFFENPQARPMGAGRELHARRKDGTDIPVEIALSPFATPDGNFVLAGLVDVTDRKRAERDKEELLGQLKTLNAELEERVRTRTAELSATLEERGVLLQEIHHRVKNNLQVISSIINMQVRKLDDRASKSALEECQTRVQAIALIHEKLYQSRDYAHVPFTDYLRSLSTSVFQATGFSAGKVRLELAIDDVDLRVDKAIPCGLLVNELITNSLKHGFPGGRSGMVRVELSRIEGKRLRLAVEDDGVGLPKQAAATKEESLGLKLVSTLSEQLNGTLVITSGPHTKFEVSFPVEG